MNNNNANKNNHFSIRKLTVGVASVLIGITFIGVNDAQQVKADVQEKTAEQQSVIGNNTQAEINQIPNSRPISSTRSDTPDGKLIYNDKVIEAGQAVVKTAPIYTLDKDPNKEYSLQGSDPNNYKFWFELGQSSDFLGPGYGGVKLVHAQGKENDSSFDRWVYLDNWNGELKFIKGTKDRNGHFDESEIQHDNKGKPILEDAAAPDQSAVYNVDVTLYNGNFAVIGKYGTQISAKIIVKAKEPEYTAEVTNSDTVTQTIITNNIDGTSLTDLRQIVLTLVNGKWTSASGNIFNEYPIPQISDYNSYYRIGENGQLIKSKTIPAYSALTTDGQPAADQVVYISYQKIEAADNNVISDNSNNTQNVDKNKPSEENTGHKTEMVTVTHIATYQKYNAKTKIQAELPHTSESTNQAGMIGMLITVAGSIFGLLGFKRRKN